jgi:hypothetical protein
MKPEVLVAVRLTETLNKGRAASGVAEYRIAWTIEEDNGERLGSRHGLFRGCLSLIKFSALSSKMSAFGP